MRREPSLPSSADGEGETPYSIQALIANDLQKRHPSAVCRLGVTRQGHSAASPHSRSRGRFFVARFFNKMVPNFANTSTMPACFFILCNTSGSTVVIA